MLQPLTMGIVIGLAFYAVVIILRLPEPELIAIASGLGAMSYGTVLSVRGRRR